MSVKIPIEGILPALALPLKSDLSIDEKQLRKHIRFLVDSGVAAIACNAHSGEVYALSREERIQVVKTCVEEVRGRIPIVAGVHSETTGGAIECAQDAKKAGANALIVFLPHILTWITRVDEDRDTDIALQWHKAIDNAVDLPMIIFQYNVNSQHVLPVSTLLRLVSEIDNIVGIKDASTDILSYIADYKAIKSVRKDVAVYQPVAGHMFPTSVFVGAQGSLTGFANFCPNQLVEQYDKIRKGDLKGAEQLHKTIGPVSDVIYGRPWVDFEARYKYATYLLGLFERPDMRPPMPPLREGDKLKIRQILAQVGLMKMSVETRL